MSRCLRSAWFCCNTHASYTNALLPALDTRPAQRRVRAARAMAVAHWHAPVLVPFSQLRASRRQLPAPRLRCVGNASFGVDSEGDGGSSVALRNRGASLVNATPKGEMQMLVARLRRSGALVPTSVLVNNGVNGRVRARSVFRTAGVAPTARRCLGRPTHA